jgi:hypothetical protein
VTATHDRISLGTSARDWQRSNSNRVVNSLRAWYIPLQVAGILAADLFWPRTNLAILYVIPLLLVAQRRELALLRRLVVCLVSLTFAVYFLKNTLTDGVAVESYFDYRLVNRATVALMILGMGWVLKTWIIWLQEQSDPELPAAARDSDREIAEILALLACALLIVLIAAVDLLAPVNYNVAILCPIPLFLCAWTSNRRLPWAMLAIMLALAIAGFFIGKSVGDQGLEAAFIRNRALAGLAMIGVTAIVCYWMTAKHALVRQ